MLSFHQSSLSRSKLYEAAARSPLVAITESLAKLGSRRVDQSARSHSSSLILGYGYGNLKVP